MKRFLTTLLLLGSLFAVSGLASAQFLEENELTARGITFNLPSNLLLTIQSGEFLIASSFESLNAYIKREPVKEGVVISVAFPSDLDDIGLTPTTPAKQVIETFKGLLGTDSPIESYDTSYGPMEVKEAFSIIWTDSRVIAFAIGTQTATFRVAGEYDTYSSSVNHLISSMALATSETATSTGDALRQWAASATATSQFGSTSWSAAQATGEPNVTRCADSSSAWASSSSTGQDSITLSYTTAVVPSEIHIYQTYNPGAITSVLVANATTGFVAEIPNSADPKGNTPCPGVFVLKVSDVAEAIDTVIITLDQTLTGNWNEIDAVELVGIAK